MQEYKQSTQWGKLAYCFSKLSHFFQISAFYLILVHDSRQIIQIYLDCFSLPSNVLENISCFILISRGINEITYKILIKFFFYFILHSCVGFAINSYCLVIAR